MSRKSGFPFANCSIKLPDSVGPPEPGAHEDENEQQLRRQLLINFGHAQWGFNNWNWAVTKQELDFVDQANGKYCAGVVAFVSITVKSFDIHRENIGYATSTANTKGFAIYKSRKCAVTNALRETLLSFGGNVAVELLEQLDSQRNDLPTPAPHPPALPPDPLQENNQNHSNKIEPKNAKSNTKKDDVAQNMRSPHPVKNNPVANAPRSPPVARAQPVQCNIPAANRPTGPLPPPPRQPPPLPRPSSNKKYRQRRPTGIRRGRKIIVDLDKQKEIFNRYKNEIANNKFKYNSTLFQMMADDLHNFISPKALHLSFKRNFLGSFTKNDNNNDCIRSSPTLSDSSKGSEKEDYIKTEYQDLNAEMEVLEM